MTMVISINVTMSYLGRAIWDVEEIRSVCRELNVEKKVLLFWEFKYWPNCKYMDMYTLNQKKGMVFK